MADKPTSPSPPSPFPDKVQPLSNTIFNPEKRGGEPSGNGTT